MSILELSRRALRGDAAAMSSLIRCLADDLYGYHPSRLETARTELERALLECDRKAPARGKIETLWELTHVFLSRIPLSLREFVELGSESVERAILDLVAGDEALGRAELRDRLGMDEPSVGRGLEDLEKLGLVASLPGAALQLTRDGREVKRWIAGQRSVARSAPGAVEAPGARPAREPAQFPSARDGLQVLRPEEARDVEAKVALGTSIWVVGVTVPNGGSFFDTVADNLRRDVQYYYVCPETDFRALSSQLARSFSQERLHGQLACIVNAPALLRLGTARIHVLPDGGGIRSMRVCWLGAEKPEPFYLAISTPSALDPDAALLDSYGRAARSLIAASQDVVLDFQRLEARVRSL